MGPQYSGFEETRSDLLRIVATYLAPGYNSAALVVHEEMPDRFRIYDAFHEPRWFVEVPWGDEEFTTALRSTRVLVVGKHSGEILYDGSARDEG